MSSTYASRSPSIFYGLLWKESMQLLPLLLALVAMSSVLHAILALIPGGKEMFPGFLILVPNIFALGAPPMAIGQEEESGTLRWLRGLPVPWWWIAGAKAGAALAGLILSWLFSIAVVALADAPGIIGGSEVFSVEAIGGMTYASAFSLYLLSCGFVVSWWLRSPIPSLLIMLPLMTALFMGTMVAARAMADQHDFSLAHTTILFAVAAVLMAIAAAAARRTLSRPWVRRRGRRWTALNATIHHAYQPVYIVPLHSPGRRFALLWQTFSQTWLVVFPLFFLGWISAVIPGIAFLGDGRSNLPMAPLSLGVLITTFLGAMVFVTDNKGRRHRFLADRGIGSYTVWWTRQAIPLLAALVLAATFALVYGGRGSGLTGLQLLLLFANAFVCGQVAGQAFRRPIVGMLAAPVAFGASQLLALSILFLYPSYSWAGIASVALLWLVTLRLCRWWTEERMDAGYYGRLAGWIGLAALALVGTIATVRYFTTPSAVPGWRGETLALAEATLPRDSANGSPLLRSHLIGNDPQPRPDSPLGQRLYDVDELRATADEVISNERGILGHRSLAEAASILETLRPQAPGASADDYRRWLRAMLLSSRRIYQSDAGWTESQAGEQFEIRAIGELLRSDSRDQLDHSAWKELVALVPTAEEREQWRRNFLLRAWLSYQRDPEYLPFFFRSGAGELRRLIPAERWRTGRLLDRAVRISLEQLDEGLPPQESPEEAKRLQAWKTLRDDEYLGADYPISYQTQSLPTSHWTQDLEQQAERLRAMGMNEARVSSD